MGIVNPPSLRCIAPYDGSIDIYRDVAYHGGVYGDFMNWWFNLMVRPNNSHLLRGRVASGRTLAASCGAFSVLRRDARLGGPGGPWTGGVVAREESPPRNI